MSFGRAVFVLGIVLCGATAAAACSDDGSSGTAVPGTLTQAQCAAHPACGFDGANPTEPCGDCYRLPCCPTPICITMREACNILCGPFAACDSLDSYPGYIQCPGQHLHPECPAVPPGTSDGSAPSDAASSPDGPGR